MSDLPIINASMFDFANVADLPDDLKVGVNTDKAEKINKVVAILDMAPRPLSISEIAAVYFRAYGETPAQVTLRNHLNAAVEEGKACKPSRQTYAKAGTAMIEEVEEVEEAPIDAEVEVDESGSDDLLDGLE
jgi:hypothetical protein